MKDVSHCHILQLCGRTRLVAHVSVGRVGHDDMTGAAGSHRLPMLECAGGHHSAALCAFTRRGVQATAVCSQCQAAVCRHTWHASGGAGAATLSVCTAHANALQCYLQDSWCMYMKIMQACAEEKLCLAVTLRISVLSNESFVPAYAAKLP